MNDIWTEKYRPTTLNEIIDQDEIKLFITGALNDKNIPHLLLYGSPGTGKTTIINILCKSFFTYSKNDFPNNYELLNENIKLRANRILILNASDEKGIKIVREKIKSFSSLSLILQNNKSTTMIPNFKIIILDEADSMSYESQFALRRIIEKYSNNTRFILICNYVNKIIPQIISRCFKFKFLPIKYNACKKIIINILQKENIHIELNEDVYEYIYNNSNGDMRKLIMLLQKISYIITKTITLDDIKKLFNELPESNFNFLMSVLKNKLSIDNQKLIFKQAQLFILKAYDLNNIINQLYLFFLKDIMIENKHKYNIINLLTIISNRINDGGIEFIHLCNLLFTINILLNNISYTTTTNPFTIKLQS